MVITPHAVAGAVAARPLSSTPIALAAGVATHLVLDRVPHQDYSLRAVPLLAADAALAAALTHRLARANPAVMLAGAIGGVLPDVAQVIERAVGSNITRPAHRANHTTVVWPRWAGVGSQLVTVAVCVGALALADRPRPHRPAVFEWPVEQYDFRPSRPAPAAAAPRRTGANRRASAGRDETTCAAPAA
jgi:hypothetical protein